MKLTLLESSPAEMTEALRWISFLKPYMRQATVGKAKAIIAGLKRDIARTKKNRPDVNTDPIHYLESKWFRISLFIPTNEIKHLLPQKEVGFHADDEFDDGEKDYMVIDASPFMDPPVQSDLPVPIPPLAQKYLLQAAVDFKEELKSLVELK